MFAHTRKSAAGMIPVLCLLSLLILLSIPDFVRSQPQKPTITKVSPKTLSLQPGGKEQILTIQGQNLQHVRGVQVFKDGKPVPAKLITARLAGRASTYSVKIRFSASPKTLTAVKYQIVLVDAANRRLAEISDVLSLIEIRRMQYSTMRGNDGTTYKIIKIGSQWWMAENLKETEYRDGTSIPNVTADDSWKQLSTGARCAYDNDEQNAKYYGYLYNWYAVTDPKNIAPSGWKVPSDEDWKTLEKYLGMSQAQTDSERSRGTNEGSKLAGNTAKWQNGALVNSGAFGTSGFNALPGSMRFGNMHGGAFKDLIGSNGHWWSSTESSSSVYGRGLSSNSSGVYRFRYGKREGFSVRLIKK